MNGQWIRGEVWHLMPVWLVAFGMQLLGWAAGVGFGLVLWIHWLGGAGLAAWVFRERAAGAEAEGRGDRSSFGGRAWQARICILAIALAVLSLIPGGYLACDVDQERRLWGVITLATWLLALTTTVPLLVLLLRNSVWAAVVGALAHVVLGVGLQQWIGQMAAFSMAKEIGFLIAIVASWALSLISYGIGSQLVDRQSTNGASNRYRWRTSKEWRVLIPIWMIGSATMITVPVAEFDWVFVWMAFLLTGVIMSVVVFGHEFSHQTMTVLLAQPVSRRRLWYEKMLVLGMALTALVLIAVGIQVVCSESQEGLAELSILFPLTLWISFTVGPAMTLVTQNNLAAMVFTPLVPGFVAWLVFVAGIWLSGESQEEYAAFLRLIIPVSVIALGAVFYLIGCRRFQRLECRESVPGEVPWASLARRRAAGATAARSEQGRGWGLVWLLRKELHLHRINLVFAGLFCLGCLAMVGLHMLRMRAEAQGDPWPLDFLGEGLYMMPFFVFWFIAPLLIGTVGIGEERQLGTLDWHLVLPPSRLHQWISKMLTAYSACLVLTMVLPATWLAYVYRPLGMIGSGEPPEVLQYYGWICLVVLILTTTAAYAASFSENTMRGIVHCIGLLAGAMVVWIFLEKHLGSYGLGVPWLYGWDMPFGLASEKAHLWYTFLGLGGLGFLFMLGILGLTFLNFKRTERTLPHTFLLPASLSVMAGFGFASWLRAFVALKDSGLI